MRPFAIARLAVAALSGAIATLAFEPFGHWPALALSLLLLWQLWYARPDLAALTGLLWGLGHFGTGVYWLYNSMHDYGNAHWLVAGLITFGFVVYLSLFPALAGWLLGRLDKASLLRQRLVRALAVSSLWWAQEYLRAFGLMGGFPWLASGYTQVDGFAAPWYPVLGVVGVGWLYVLIIALLHLGLQGWWSGLAMSRQRARLPGGGAKALSPRSLALLSTVGCALACALILYGGRALPEWTAPAGEAIAVSALHTDLPQSDKFTTMAVHEAVKRNFELTEQAAPGLVVWPETALPFSARSLHSLYIGKVNSLANRRQLDILTGIFRRGGTGASYNAVYANIGSRGSYYDKQRLVPFGEYMPARSLFGFFETMVDIPQSDLAQGLENPAPFAIGGHSVHVNICYELFFPDLLHRQARESQLLVNVSNDAWFGRAVAPAQSLQMARARAKETGRPIVRASNQGISAIVDAHGQVLARTDGDYQLIEADLEPRQGLTPLLRHGEGKIIAAIAILAIIATVAAASLGRARRRR